MTAKRLRSFIFARGGSKGIIRKNLQEINGIPLIGHAINSAIGSKFIESVFVSTDDEEIREVALSLGAEVPFIRPNELASDASPELLAWRHAISFFSSYYLEGTPRDNPFIVTPATSPLRTSNDIDLAINKYFDSKFDVIFGVSKSHRNPYLNMVKISEDGKIDLVINDSEATRRQDTPEVFDISTSVYVANPQYIMCCKKILGESSGAVILPSSRTIDIDEPYDLHLAKLLLKYPYTKGHDSDEFIQR